jgi:hypothetical protein
MGREVYLRICNWERFQHYRDRNPPWIKNYTELLSDEAYLGLSGHRRSILHGLWLEYARSNCRLSLDTRMLTRRLNLKVTTSDLLSLNDAGFVAIPASTMQAWRPKPASASRARPRTRERHIEKESQEPDNQSTVANYAANNGEPPKDIAPEFATVPATGLTDGANDDIPF